MTDRELTLIAIALEYGMNLEEVKEIYNRWDNLLEEMESIPHGGDCTNEAYRCYRCLIEEAREMIPIYRYLFNL